MQQSAKQAAFTLLWLFVILGIPGLIMLLFGLNGYLNI